MPRRTFVDAGANIGTTTMAALAWHGFNNAVAVEPHPTNAQLIAATAALNGYDDPVHVIAAATLDHEDGATLRVHRGNSSMHTVSAKGDLRVPSVTLDRLDLEDVNLLWINAEG